MTTVLYYAPTSPYCRKNIFSIYELGLEDQIKLEQRGDTEKGNAHSPLKTTNDVDHAHPQGRLPVLEYDGKAYYDSKVISQWLDQKAGGNKLFSTDNRLDQLVLEAAADGACDAALLLGCETRFRPENLRWLEWIEGQKSKVTRTLQGFEKDQKLPDPAHRGALPLGGLAAAALCRFVDLRFIEHFDSWRSDFPKLAHWYDQVGQRPAFKKMVEEVYSKQG